MGKEMLPDMMSRGGQTGPTHLSPAERNGRGPGENERQLQDRAVLRRVSVHRLRPNRYQPAGRATRDIPDLADSLHVQGLIHPPLARRYGKGEYELATGHRRVEAWRFLVASGLRDPKIRIFVADLSDDDLLFLALAEGRHREDFTAVEEAEFVDQVREVRASELGREPTVRDLSDVIPTSYGKTAIAEALVIARALEDTRIGHLVRQADKVGKSLLYSVLRCDDFSRKRAALKVAADGGAAKDVKAALRKKSGRPKKTVLHKKIGEHSYDLSVRIRADMSLDQMEEAIQALEAAVVDLKGRRSDASS